METNGIQRQIPIMGEARKPAFVDDALITSCQDGRGDWKARRLAEIDAERAELMRAA